MKVINQTLDQLKPHAAGNWHRAINALMSHAVAAGMLTANPATNVKPPKAKSIKHASWSAAEMAQYEATHPIGTKARLAFALARYTGAARSDIARLGPAHIVNGEIVIARQKTKVTVTIPLLPELKAVIEATPITGMSTFLVTKTGKAFAPGTLSDKFRRWCDQAGLPPQYTLHGLRHAMGDTIATHGGSPSEVAAVLGHSNVQTALHYMQEADRKRMARNAMARLKENG